MSDMDELAHDHAEVERALRHLRGRAQAGAQLGPPLVELQISLERHFEIEERELFPRLRDVAADLAGDIDALERDHAELLDALARVSQLIDDEQAAEVRHVLDEMWDIMERHSELEASIMAVTHDDAFPGEVMPD